MRYGPQKKEKRGLTSKLFGSSKGKDQASQKKAMQKLADLEAATKLKQLYKTMKIGSGAGMLSEVKYRYLSASFRRRHGLGKEYRVEKPRTFMGEVVEGSVGGGVVTSELGIDGLDESDIVFSDEEMEGEGDGSSYDAMVSGAEEGQSKGEQRVKSPQQRQRVKRKKINDWVVNAFASHRKRPSSESQTSLWSTVERGAILEAAWKSRAAELLAATQKNRRRGVADNRGSKMDGEAPNHHGMEAASSTSGGTGGYGASKMFQSVMTRVGSNGRIFGAYPNDALPIEECANEKGVIQLARRYGYGDWRAADNVEHDEDLFMQSDDEAGDDSWGGGDLLFGGGDRDDGIDSPSPFHATNREGKSRRRKKKQTSSSISSQGDVEFTKVKTRRRKRVSEESKVSTLGISGGGGKGIAADARSPKSRFSFELGLNASSSKHRTAQRHPFNNRSHSKANTFPLSTPTRRRESALSELHKRNSLLLTTDTTAKAPMQRLTELKKRSEKNDEN